jgi:hypothetical protein
MVVLATVAFWPSLALADNTSCANGDFLFMGIGRGQSITNGTPRYYKVRVVEGRSYSVYSWAPFQDTGEGGASINHVLWSNSTCTVTAGVVSSSAKEPRVDVTGHTGDNDTIIPNFTGTMYIEVQNNGGTSYTIYTAIQETTIFSPWFYVAGTNNAFAEIKNATDASIQYTLTAFGANGTACGTSSGTLAANGNTAINIRLLGTCQAAGSGSAQVAFQGPPGAVVGNITTLDATTGLSFDSPFSPRMPWAISTQ